MENYINQWFSVLDQMKNTNTYKLAWGKAILDISKLNGINRIPFSLIAEHMLKYYWNQMYFFNLKQGPLNQEPTLYQIVRKTIQDYQISSNSKLPVWFNIAQSSLIKDRDNYEKRLQKIVKVLHKDVSWRFILIDGNEIPLYEIDRDKNEVILKEPASQILSKDGHLLMPYIYLKWAQLLEKFNRAPKIANKVAGSGNQEIKRKSLTIYRDILLKLYANKPIYDFYTNKLLNPDDISIDHFIPWSYIYSDDLWNLVITSKSNNSRKSNKLSSKVFLKKIIEQNKKLIELIQDNSLRDTIKEAIDHHYLEKFYNDLTTI